MLICFLYCPFKGFGVRYLIAGFVVDDCACTVVVDCWTLLICVLVSMFDGVCFTCLMLRVRWLRLVFV